MADKSAPPSLQITSKVDGKTYTIGQVYQTAEGGEVIIDRFDNTRILAPLVAARKRLNNSTDITEEVFLGKSYNDLDKQLHLASVQHRLGALAKTLGGSHLGEEATQIARIINALNNHTPASASLLQLQIDVHQRWWPPRPRRVGPTAHKPPPLLSL
ncbi:unnamed protein product [Macrosiphum euphorbiae]|uniref:Uncharacterized protein n=1 Tax=Macrosiphum euphorbiae TaxID=13131 RepID=A0AAV0XKZ9_9HEMI|nr:unnamed protein product [Macrosiphum euphorbiae]